MRYFWTLDAVVSISPFPKFALIADRRFLSRIVGAEVRKVIHDGWPMSHAIATDLRAGMVLSCRLHPSRENNVLSAEQNTWT